MKNVNWERNQNILRNNIAKLGIKQLLVHSDSFKSLSFIDFDGNQDENLLKHVVFLSSLCPNVVLPRFNYDFPKTKVFDFDNFSSQTGAISETFSRIYKAKTFDPMFSMSYMSGLDSFSSYAKKVNTFRPTGIFESLVTDNSGILLYGVDITSATLIHYVETMSDVAYRYDKQFAGVALINGCKNELEFESHFRPMGCYLDYDWKRISDELAANELVISSGRYCHLFDAKKLFNFWYEKMNKDPLYFLDKLSISWVEPKLDVLGRRFRRTDFETE